jgi:hypothetical protein
MQQAIAFVHVVEERRQIRTKDAIDSQLVGSPNEQLTTYIDLQPGGFADVDMSVDKHRNITSKTPSLSFVKGKLVLSESNEVLLERS